MMTGTDSTSVSYLTKGGRRLAYVHSPGSAPGVFFLGGFKSSMQGLKAIALETYCRQHGIGFTRFDYSGHGQSSGEFASGCISDWLSMPVPYLTILPRRRQLVVGSSMGAWIATLLVLQRPAQAVGVIALASALDFTRDLTAVHMNDEQRMQLRANGVTYLPSCYDDETPYPITQKLIDDGEQHCLLNQPIPLEIPVHLIHGLNDQDINWRTSLRFAEQLARGSAELTLIKNGDHRLSSPEHLALIGNAVAKMRVRI